MDIQTSAPLDGEVSGEGPYLRRAQSLLALRAELFDDARPRSLRFDGVAAPPHGRTASGFRQGGRQLALPLPRECGGRRARMVG